MEPLEKPKYITNKWSLAQPKSSIFFEGNFIFKNRIFRLLCLQSTLFLQCLLLHPTFSKSSKAILIRRGLAPINFLGSIKFFLENLAKPLEDNCLINFEIAFLSEYFAAKSIEWGFFKGPIYSTPLRFIKGTQRWNKEDLSEDEKKRQEGESCSKLRLVGWTVYQISSFRGLGFSWGMAHEANNSSLLEIIFRYFRVKIVTIITTCLIIASRDSIDGKAINLLRDLGVPEFSGLNLMAELFLNILFGICLCCKLDNGFTFCNIIVKVAYKFLTCTHAPKSMCDFLNPLYYPHFFYSPHTTNSLADFWGKGWHQLFRRIFLICGGKPAIYLANLFGASERITKSIGIMGVFLASATFHEYLPWAVFQGSTPNPYIPFRTFPGSGFFFMVQPIGIFIEPYIIPWIPQWAGGGKLWVWSFLAIVATPFRQQYIGPYRFANTIPPFSKLSWKDFAMPT
ncbi:hypothetical protein BY996DRAFT_4591026 [Phakopsora pachyrhizi]|uniref:Wax synthase domain-containing protein n=1 Tax=Phakopsora pachyrhizi TaxID=170000 RepID=A0AAV0B817_PHAPC|nr:hypothetical protein BY996DRAFT_4591026 [Phakopsora pachyrhizi]CAH7681446.1 hypothetical protein PPACK8108_LOCUS14036 [Phakopsora pachyrhizi]